MKKYPILICVLLVICGGIFFFYKSKGNELFSITLVGKNNASSYFVEIANTPEKAEMGLMYRKSMPKNQGMLFVFPYPSIIKMWMKNTYIPLDMIFFNAQNQVICLHENARPLDESIISCPYPAKLILELNAGEIKKKDIKLGDALLMK